MIDHPHIAAALQLLDDLGLPRAQQNERSALTLLALLDLRPDREWRRAGAPLIGITPIMDWMRTHYEKHYKANSREGIRRRTMVVSQFEFGGPAGNLNRPRRFPYQYGSDL